MNAWAQQSSAYDDNKFCTTFTITHNCTCIILFYFIILSYYGAYVYVYRVSLFIYLYFLFTIFFIYSYLFQYLLFNTCLLFIVYCLLFVKIVRNEYEYQDKFLICVNVFGNKPFLILILILKASSSGTVKVRCLPQGLLNTQTINPPVTSKPALPPELSQPFNWLIVIKIFYFLLFLFWLHKSKCCYWWIFCNDKRFLVMYKCNML